MKWRRKQPCSDCGGDYVIDAERQTGRCRCGLFRKLQVPAKWFLDLFFEPLK